MVPQRQIIKFNSAKFTEDQLYSYKDVFYENVKSTFTCVFKSDINTLFYLNFPKSVCSSQSLRFLVLALNVFCFISHLRSIKGKKIVFLSSSNQIFVESYLFGNQSLRPRITFVLSSRFRWNKVLLGENSPIG